MYGRIQWHPAFCAALKIELENDREALIFEEEHLLSNKPMQVDIIVIKKQAGHNIKKKIGHIFRGHNLFEYKSPDDTLSINDFYKVCGYACFYQSDTEAILEIDPNDITITLVCSHYPEKMLRHIHQYLNMDSRLYAPGIYHLTGGVFPMQLLVIPELSQEEYYWMQNLRKDLKSGGEIRHLLEAYGPNRQSKLYQSVLDVILRANWEETEAERKMCEALKELFAEDIKESEKRGRTEGWAQMKRALKLQQSGLNTDEIAKVLDLPVPTVEEMLED